MIRTPIVGNPGHDPRRLTLSRKARWRLVFEKSRNHRPPEFETEKKFITRSRRNWRAGTMAPT